MSREFARLPRPLCSRLRIARARCALQVLLMGGGVLQAGVAPAVLAQPAQGAQVVDAGAVQRATQKPEATDRASRIDALEAARDTDGLAAEVHAALAAPSDAIVREWLLDRGLHALARQAPTAAAKRVVHEIAQRRPEVMVRVDPDHGGHAVPLYDPGATARFVLGTWARTAARESTLAALASGSGAPLDTFASLDSASRAGVVDAFMSLPLASLAGHRDAILGGLERGERLDELALTAATRLRDAALLEAVIGYADGASALAAVRDAHAVLSDASALDVLIAATRRPEVASAALLQIGALARDDARARELLFAALDDGHNGASAAAALADLHDSAVAARLGERLRTGTSERALRHGVLTLKLDGSAAARAELERFMRLGTGSAQLRKEVRTWLAQ